MDDDIEIQELTFHAQRAGEARLMACMDVIFDEDIDEDFDDGACAPFCGCNTCCVRETIDAAWPFLYKLAHQPAIIRMQEGLE